MKREVEEEKEIMEIINCAEFRKKLKQFRNIDWTVEIL